MLRVSAKFVIKELRERRSILEASKCSAWTVGVAKRLVKFWWTSAAILHGRTSLGFREQHSGMLKSSMMGCVNSANGSGPPAAWRLLSAEGALTGSLLNSDCLPVRMSSFRRAAFAPGRGLISSQIWVGVTGGRGGG